MSKNTPKKKPDRSARPASGGDIVVRATRRSEPDLRRLARALIGLAQQELQREGEAAEQTTTDEGEAA